MTVPESSPSPPSALPAVEQARGALVADALALAGAVRTDATDDGVADLLVQLVLSADVYCAALNDANQD